MPSIKYTPLSTLLKKFGAARKELHEELSNCGISWGSEKQVTLGDALYIYDVIQDKLTCVLMDCDDANDRPGMGRYRRYLDILDGIRDSGVKYYRMDK